MKEWLGLIIYFRGVRRVRIGKHRSWRSIFTEIHAQEPMTHICRAFPGTFFSVILIQTFFPCNSSLRSYFCLHFLSSTLVTDLRVLCNSWVGVFCIYTYSYIPNIPALICACPPAVIELVIPCTSLSTDLSYQRVLKLCQNVKPNWGIAARCAVRWITPAEPH